MTPASWGILLCALAALGSGVASLALWYQGTPRRLLLRIEAMEEECAETRKLAKSTLGEAEALELRVEKHLEVLEDLKSTVETKRRRIQKMQEREAPEAGDDFDNALARARSAGWQV
jgi:hypothetical protein